MAAAAEPAAPAAAAGAKRKRDDAAAEPPPGQFPAEWDEAEVDGDAAWWGRLRLVDVALADPVALLIASHLRKCNGWLCSVRRVQSRQLWRKYTRCRDEDVGPTSVGGRANEVFLFYGTGATPPLEVKTRPKALGLESNLNPREPVYISNRLWLRLLACRPRRANKARAGAAARS